MLFFNIAFGTKINTIRPDSADSGFDKNYSACHKSETLVHVCQKHDSQKPDFNKSITFTLFSTESLSLAKKQYSPILYTKPGID